MAALFCPCTLQGQEGPVHTDTLSLRVYFRPGEHVIRPEYMANGERLRAFSEAINSHGGGQVRSVTISAGASPDGNTRKNQELSAARAQSLRVFFHTAFPQDSFSATTTVNALGEDWDGLLESLAALDEPWRDRAVDIIRHTPVRVRDDRGKIVAGRKRQLEVLNGGKAWRYMEEHVFQDLRCASGLITCVFSGATPPCSVTANLPQVSGEDLHVVPRDTVVARDTVYIVQRDTVWRDARSVPDTTQKKERTGKVVLAFRTNVLAVPLANVGLEVPLGNHWSLAADWYYPWIWRPGQKAGVDTNGWCFQFLAAGAEARYWFGSAKRRTPNHRLTGHSVGVYGAVGYYDFENNFKGHQGRFYNVGVDYLYACPIFRDAMRLEFELGVGYIYSPSQPYDCFVAGDVCYRRKGVTHYVRWFGPTRAQISLVVPIRVKDKKECTR